MTRSSREGRSADTGSAYRRVFRRRGRAAQEDSKLEPPPSGEPAVTTRSDPQREPSAPPARAWNLWELERRAREQAGDNPRAEEWSALFTHLRVFAKADGELPKEFDPLVRESFGQLIEAA